MVRDLPVREHRMDERGFGDGSRVGGVAHRGVEKAKRVLLPGEA
jgi:hypothetical protein